MISAFKAAWTLQGRARTLPLSKLAASKIPAFYPKLMRDFYLKFALNEPVDVCGFTVLPYQMVFEFAGGRQDVIPIALKNGRMVYIDRFEGAPWDLRVRMGVGGGREVVLSENIFTFFGKYLAGCLLGGSADE